MWEIGILSHKEHHLRELSDTRVLFIEIEKWYRE